MKIDMRSRNPCMWDPVAYRVKRHVHPRVGQKWCIFPSYDFEHCLVDSFEDIDLSLCSAEFEIRRESYYWLLDQLDLWKAYVWEFGRLNVTHTVMSKRKLKDLVLEGKVDGWNDPRLPTLKGLRRRGFTPAAINAFCAAVSATRATATTIDEAQLAHFLRKDLQGSAPRGFAVLHPVKLTLLNVPRGTMTQVEAPRLPGNEAAGKRQLWLQREIFVDAADVRADPRGSETEPKAGKRGSFIGLQPGAIVNLRYADTIRCEEVICRQGRIAEVTATVLDPQRAQEAIAQLHHKLGSIHWLAGERPGAEPPRGEVRLYNSLFSVGDPMALKDWREGLNPESKIVVENAMLEPSLLHLPVESHVQFERLGYFTVDPDTTRLGKMVYNRSCTLHSFRVCSRDE